MAIVSLRAAEGPLAVFRALFTLRTPSDPCAVGAPSQSDVLFGRSIEERQSADSDVNATA
jgi:hypothetical protein